MSQRAIAEQHPSSIALRPVPGGFVKVEFLTACACALVFPALVAKAGDSSEAAEGGARDHLAPFSAFSSRSPVEAMTPWIHPSMPGSVRKKLETAFAIAVTRVSAVPECADLFHRLGADAVETLRTGLYFPASPARETSVCRRSMAQTYVGDAPTWICRRVTSYSDERVALAVIHEALHHAGLTEKPHDRNAMSSGAINKLVGIKCGF